jgi:hypothetical protein
MFISLNRICLSSVRSLLVGYPANFLIDFSDEYLEEEEKKADGIL